MIKELVIVEPDKDLIDSLYSSITEEAQDRRDLSDTMTIFPSMRIGVFLKERLSEDIGGTFFPPAMLTTDQFIEDLFKLNHPGFRSAEGPESSIMIYRAVQKRNFRNAYTGYKEGDSFSAFHPWGKELVKVVEELLVEGADLNVDRAIYERFVELGDYHLEYKDFISLLPALVEEYVGILSENRLYTRGICYSRVAELAEEGTLELRKFQRTVFAGVNAFNRCEEKIFKYINSTGKLELIVKSEAALLKSGEWPYHHQKRAMDRIGVTVPSVSDREINEDSYDNVDIVPVTNRETGMVMLFNRLKEDLKDTEQVRKVGIVMSDPAALLPFIQGVVSRFTEEESNRIAFNISMGYPMSRTPVFQLIRLMLKMQYGKVIPAADYLNLMRHPYVKLSAEDQESCRAGVWILSRAIIDRDISGVELNDIETLAETFMEEKETESREQILLSIKEIHEKFFVTKAGDSKEIIERVRNVIEGLKKNAAGHLLLNEYVNSALEVIDDFLTFKYPEIIESAPATGVLGIFLRDLEGSKVQFHGTPVMGVQVMGMLEFRGLSFDRLYILDAVEGILPESFKYDPLLPSDIRKVFGIRSFGDLEQLYAYNFFTMIKSAGDVVVYYPENQKGDGVRSRYIEKILLEKEKAGKPHEKKDVHVVFKADKEGLRSVPKRDTHLENLKLSPSMLEEYIACPLKFYYKNIVKLKPERTVTDVMESDIVGIMIHELMEEIYKNLVLEDINPEIVEKLLHEKWTGGLKKEGIKNLRISGFEPDKGIGRIRFRTISQKLYEYLRLDMRRVKEQGIRVIGHEKSYDFIDTLDNRQLRFTGRVDRLEKEGDIYRIIDYKTGSPFSVTNSSSGLDSFDPSSINCSDYQGNLAALRDCEKLFGNFQILLYSRFCMKDVNAGEELIDGAYAFILEPGKYFMPVYKNRNKDDDSHKSRVVELFNETLEAVVRDLFTRDSFLPNPTVSHCRYCHYRISCRNN